MYLKGRGTFAPDFTFAAAFAAETAPSPFHNNTCDGCHVRNGSGVPINTKGKLDPKLQEFMKATEYQPYNPKDYTFTGKIRPMKLVFFDLQRDTAGVDASRYSEPMSFPESLFVLIEKLPRTAEDLPELEDLEVDELYYDNKIMNFYGDSFHVTRSGYNYDWTYEEVDPNRMVVPDVRETSENPDKKITYEPLQVKLGEFQTSSSCQLKERPNTSKPWPETCADINNAAIHAAIDDRKVGFMLLNGKRLGNLGAIEAIPNKTILGFHENQKAELGKKGAGEVIWNAGSRDGQGVVRKRCETSSLIDCFIGRFGWLGDRASLEDQVANAAFVEMNMTTREGYQKLYPKKGLLNFPSVTQIRIVVLQIKLVSIRPATRISPKRMLTGWRLTHAGWVLQRPPSFRCLSRRLSKAKRSSEK